MSMTEIEVKGLSYSGYAEDYIFQTVRKTGDFYEAGLLRKWTPLLGNPSTILDIGANIGNHTLYWEKYISPKCIVAFEPYPDNYKCLYANLENNHIKNVIVVSKAVGDRVGVAEIESFDSSNYGATSFRYSKSGRAADGQVPVTTVDMETAAHGISKVDFVKIDSEGFELRILQGMAGVIGRDTPAIWVEAGRKTAEPVLEFLFGKGYQLIDMEGANLLFLHEKKAETPEMSTGAIVGKTMLHVDRANLYYDNYEKSKQILQQQKEQIAVWKEKYQAAEENYQTAKEWLNSKEKALDEMRSREKERQNQLEICQDNYQKATDWLKDKTCLIHELETSRADVQLKLQQAQDAMGQIQLQLENAQEKNRFLETALEQEQEAAASLRSEKERYFLQLRKDAQEWSKERALLIQTKNQVLQLNAHIQQLSRQNKLYEEKLHKIYGTWYGRIVLKTYKVLRKIKNIFIRR